jgi:hypothetical protein
LHDSGPLLVPIEFQGYLVAIKASTTACSPSSTLGTGKAGDWQPNAIQWLVDGEVVYKRNTWEPTPIPNQPLQFNVNLWHSRSKEFAGSLSSAHLPVSAGIRSVEIHSSAPTETDELDDPLNAVAASRP